MQTAGLIWRDIVEGDDDERYGSKEQPGFRDSAAWGEWLVTVTSFTGSEQDLADLGCHPLAAIYCDGMEAEEVEWSTPEDMTSAADRLGQLIREGNPRTRDIIDAYAQICEENAVASDLMLEELEVVKDMALWANSIGKTQIAFEIG